MLAVNSLSFCFFGTFLLRFSKIPLLDTEFLFDSFFHSMWNTLSHCSLVSMVFNYFMLMKILCTCHSLVDFKLFFGFWQFNFVLSQGGSLFILLGVN